MTTTPIYKDHTGKWREKNPYDSFHESLLWPSFERNVKYYDFPNAPEVKPGEVVMAYLQKQWQRRDEWIDVDDITPINPYCPTRQIWVAANQSEKPFWEKAHDILVEGKEEQAPIIQRLNKIEEVLSETVKLVNELAIAVRKRFENERR